MRKNDRIEACGRTIDYEIVYSKRRKRAAIVISPDLTVEFRAPVGLGPEEIRSIVRRKAGWVRKKLEWFEANRQQDPLKSYVNAEKYLYLGKEYSLKIIPVAGTVKPMALFEGAEIVCRVPENVPVEFRSVPVKEAVHALYREHAEVKVGEFVSTYSEKMGILPPVFKVKFQKKRWGSCSANNVLRINFQLMMAPPKQLEYVVVHELCHVKEKNHSSRFWKLVGDTMPNYKVHREGLKRDGWKYVL